MKELLSAATTCPSAKAARPGSGSGLALGLAQVAMAMVGPPTIMPIAKAVISRPAGETLTPRSLAISGSSPAMTNSVVPVRNVPAASTQTTKGSLPGAVPATEGMRVLLSLQVAGGVRKRLRW
ncbi:hypothetical protein [Streptomyces sp. NPDC059909]|uniref:hypothetical protein n=1 Tax=Streptomyces sp. NPDC059909 TaxID=3346998 RepID=UPI00365D1472